MYSDDGMYADGGDGGIEEVYDVLREPDEPDPSSHPQAAGEYRPDDQEPVEGYGDYDHEIFAGHDPTHDVHPDYALDEGGLGVVTVGRRRRRWIGVVVLALCALLVAGAGFVGFDQVRQLAGSFGGSSDYPGPGTGEVTVTISDGDSGRAIGQTLEEAGVVKSSGAFVDALAESGANNAMQPGTYLMKLQMSAAGAVELLQNPESRVSIVIRLREGLWLSETYAAISAETGFTTEQLTQAVTDPAVGLPEEAAGNPEGYLFPATYSFNPDVTPVQVLAAMVTKYKEEMVQAKVAPADQRRVLILASLVQAEASNPEDFPKVARVIENRLAKQPTVPLGFDTTVNYAVQKRGFDLTRADLNVDSPYNTRKYPGLPPGPIDSPGAAAIEAAAAPAEGDWMYFVTTNPDTGETLFTANYDEFLRGKDEFNRWYAAQQTSTP